MTAVQSQTHERLRWALGRLQATYPSPTCALEFKSPFQLTVATILSAQCTDERVNKTTPAFFEKFPTAVELAKAKSRDVEKLVFSTGFYKNKAKNLVALAKELVKSHGGKIPKDLATLESLPGIGRKTANVVLGNAFGIASGIAVDTHVTRMMNLLKIVRTQNAVVIERTLKDIVPKEDWISFTHYFITHGRAVCIARRPQCGSCVLSEKCPSRKKR